MCVLIYVYADMLLDVLYFNIYVLTYKHTNIRTYLHTYIHACMHTYIHTYVSTYRGLLERPHLLREFPHTPPGLAHLRAALVEDARIHHLPAGQT